MRSMQKKAQRAGVGRLWSFYCQRNNRRAAPKLARVQVSRIPHCFITPANPVPSIITPRSASFKAVNGSSEMNGCITSGKFSDAKNTPDPLAGVSPREREVLSLLLDGMPNKLIARRLEISEKTVKSHLTSIFRQLGVTDRVQAILWAERQGLRAEDLAP